MPPVRASVPSPTNAPTRILLVDDNVAYARLVELLLEEALGATVVTRHAGTLAAALDILAREGADCVLLDLSLPDAHGLRTLTRMRAAHPTVPVLVLSGFDGPGVDAEVRAAGAAAFVMKGDEPARLAPELTRALVAARGAAPHSRA